MSAANGASVQASGSASASARPAQRPALSVAVEEQALSSGLVLQVLNGSEFASLTGTTQSSATVPDYCALLLNLPQLPQPGDLSKLPASVLSAVPTSALSQVLPTLPSSTLSSVLTELPTSNLSSVLTEPAELVPVLGADQRVGYGHEPGPDRGTGQHGGHGAERAAELDPGQRPV